MRREIAIDAIGLIGFGAFVYGVWQMHHAAAFLVGGGCAVAWSILKGART